jgi:uncharacterized protein
MFPMSPLWKRQNRYLLDWSTFDQSVGYLKGVLEGRELTSIVGIARGGLVPAVALSHHLKISNVSVIAIVRNKSDELYSDRRPPFVAAEVKVNVAGQDVLIVDDIVGDGQTMLLARDQITECKPRSITTAALALNCGSTFRPDFFVFEVDDWVTFPWEDIIVDSASAAEVIKLSLDDPDRPNK